jgi:AraC-like DNA-binding protein
MLAGMSARHANRLLAFESTSLERFILSERLRRCYAALDDRKRDYLAIGEIAYANGFNDVSHFSRSFRARYGLSPKDFRATSRNS